jgi:TRAP-type C4-dicarboxylate transport system permease small subunit
MVSLFHLGGSWARKRFRVLSTALHAVGTLSTGAAIALVGQIFNIQEHWPAAVLMWALAALAGWILLHDEAQQTLTLLLFPAWLLSEFTYYAEGHIGENVYQGRFLIAWAVLYLTFFLGSKRRIVQGILFAVGAIAAVTGVVVLTDSWRSLGDHTYLPLGLRTWGWVFIAVLPLLLAVFKFSKSVIPVVVAICFSIALPWCRHIWTKTLAVGDSDRITYTRSEPNLAAHVLVAAFAVFIIWWGVRQTSQALVNLGIVGFAIAVGWFYYSDILDKFGRSLGLIGLGILFLAGGWALEKMRRKLLTRMGKADDSAEEAL